MSTTVNVSSNFVGNVAGKLFVQAFLQSDTIKKQAINVLPNVLGSGFLPAISYTADMQAFSCGWNPSGTINFSEVEVVVKKYTIQHEICKNDFASTFNAMQEGLFKADGDIPADIKAALLDAILKNLGQKIDYNIWQGNGTTHQFNGILTQLGATGSGVISVTATSSLTTANIVSEMQKFMTAIPSTIIDDETLTIAVSKDVERLYKDALSVNYASALPNLSYEANWQGRPLVTLGGLGTKKMIAFRKNNVNFLTGLESDINEIKISDDQERLDSNLRVKVSFTGGVGYSDATEIVLYK